MQLHQQIILASSSPWRRKMLEDAGVACQAIASGFDESSVSAEKPQELAVLLARKKAQIVFESHPGSIVIGADQVAHDGEGCFGKPSSPEDHLERLWSLRGKEHWLTTGVAILSPDEQRVFSVKTGIRFRSDLSRSELQAYVESGEGSECAGGYQIEGRGAWLIERVTGDWFNVVGLPVLEVVSVLRSMGWKMGHSKGPRLATSKAGL